MLEENDCISFRLGGSFLINAGIMGLIRVLNCKKVNAVQNTDFELSGRKLLVSKEFIAKTNWGKAYIDSMVEYYGKETKFEYLLNKKTILDNTIEKIKLKNDEKLSKNALDIMNEFGDMLLKNSFIAGYIIAENETGLEVPDVNNIKLFRKEKEIDVKYAEYIKLHNLVSQEELKKILITKELMYSKINMFYDNISFFQSKNLKMSIVDCYNAEFTEPLLDEISNSKDGKKRCIECRGLFNVVKPISFINQTDDVNRKKAHYWNQKTDAYVCSYCAFLYSLVPFGFIFSGRNAVFVNSNTSVTRMLEMKRRCEELNNDDKISEKSKLYRVFTSKTAKIASNGTSNIQVVVRMKDKQEYDIKIISKKIVEGFNEAQKNNYLTNLEKIFIKNDKEYISIYDCVIENILNGRNLYYVFDSTFALSLKNNLNMNYLRNVLQLQFIFDSVK